MKIILDPQGGTCGGVRRVIEVTEGELEGNCRDIYVLGDIIHNEREVDRLAKAGLKTLYVENLDNIAPVSIRCDTRFIIRAHGEPPVTFEKLEKLGVTIIDGTCPVVTKSQKLAHKYCSEGYQVAIVGKHNHPETIGILGHTEHDAIVVEYDEDVLRLKPGMLTLVMAQTTISPEKFSEMTDKIKAQVGEIVERNTICKSVIKRSEQLIEFAQQVDVLLVVGGLRSSNTKMLHLTCLDVNPRSYHVSTPEEIDYDWFKGAETVGVTGSASTPFWLLEEFVRILERWVEV